MCIGLFTLAMCEQSPTVHFDVFPTIRSSGLSRETDLRISAKGL